MRKALEKIRKEKGTGKHWWTAVVSAYGERGRGHQSVLLTNVRLRDDENIAANHLWITGRDAQKFGYKEGSTVVFRGKIMRYNRNDGTHDYTIGWIRNLRSLS